MKPVKQATQAGCLQACIATITGLPLPAVPLFQTGSNAEQQLHAAQRWLSRFGWTAVEVRVRRGRRFPWITQGVGALCIVGLTVGKVCHAVVGYVDREGVHVIHDPSPAAYKIEPHHITSVVFLCPTYTGRKPNGPDILTTTFLG